MAVKVGSVLSLSLIHICRRTGSPASLPPCAMPSASAYSVQTPASLMALLRPCKAFA